MRDVHTVHKQSCGPPLMGLDGCYRRRTCPGKCSIKDDVRALNLRSGADKEKTVTVRSATVQQDLRSVHREIRRMSIAGGGDGVRDIDVGNGNLFRFLGHAQTVLPSLR